MAYYSDGYTGNDSYEHQWYVTYREKGLDVEDADLMCRIRVAKEKDWGFRRHIQENGIAGLESYVRSHWPNLCAWCSKIWETIKGWFGY